MHNVPTKTKIKNGGYAIPNISYNHLFEEALPTLRTDAGKIIASGVWTEGDVKHTQYPQKAYELGKNI